VPGGQRRDRDPAPVGGAREGEEQSVVDHAAVDVPAGRVREEQARVIQHARRRADNRAGRRAGVPPTEATTSSAQAPSRSWSLTSTTRVTALRSPVAESTCCRTTTMTPSVVAVTPDSCA